MIFRAASGLPLDTQARDDQVERVASTTASKTASKTAKVPFRRRPMPLRLTLYAAQLLAGALLANLASAQGSDELGRLIFEVAPIPVEGYGPAGGAGTGPALVSSPLPGASPDEPPNLDADISAYRARINDIQNNDNPYSNELREQYDALGTLLQRNDEHEEAIKAFEAAMHIDRVNAGLYTLDQIPLVEKIIASHEALGNASEVNDFHGYLFYIQQKSFPRGDPRLLAAQEEWADWNVESYLKDSTARGGTVSFDTGGGLTSNDYVAVQNPRDGSFVYVPRSQMLGAMNPLAGRPWFDPNELQMHGVDAERVIDERLNTARDYYETIVVPGEEEETADLNPADERRLERKLANVAYAIKSQIASIETVDDPTSLFANGRNAQNYRAPLVVTRGYQDNRDMLEATAQEIEQDPAASAVDKAQAWIDVGDWNVGFDYAQRGQDAYQKAWELLSAAGMDAAAIQAVFMPELLVPAPAFATHPYSREIHGIDAGTSIDYKGHMDLTLNVSRYGDVSGIRIDAAVPEASQVLRSELIDYLRGQKVRPAVVDGETVRREDVKLRYYYSY